MPGKSIERGAIGKRGALGGGEGMGEFVRTSLGLKHDIDPGNVAGNFPVRAFLGIGCAIHRKSGCGQSDAGVVENNHGVGGRRGKLRGPHTGLFGGKGQRIRPRPPAKARALLAGKKIILRSVDQGGAGFHREGVGQQIGAVQSLDYGGIAVDVRANLPVGGDMRVFQAVRAEGRCRSRHARVVDGNDGIGRRSGNHRLVHAAGFRLDHDRR